MDLQQIEAWAFDLTGWSQRVMWSLIALVVGYLAGLIVARALVFSWRRIMGFAHRKSDREKHDSADGIAIYLLGSLVRALGILAGAAIAAWIFGLPVKTLQDWAIKGLLALIILIAVWFLGSWFGSRIRTFGDRIGRRSGGGSSRTLFAFLASLVRFSALAIGLIAALQQFGFPIASLVAVIGAAGLAVALALQDTLKAVAAGVIIAIFRPYRIGDFVKIAGQEGTVADITPFTTSLNTIDNREVTVTNDKAWGDVITNFSTRSLRRLDLTFSIDYGDDIDKAMNVILGVFRADPRVRDEPPVWMKVWALAASSVDIRVRAWCANGDMMDLRGDMLKRVKQAFDREGITIPYPHQVDIHRDFIPARPNREIPEENSRESPRGLQPTD